MNLYFILEGEKTEVALYPKWIEYILPKYTQVSFEHQACANNYYIFSGGGIPSMYSHTVNAIKNINDNPIYDKLIVCIDAEEVGVARTLHEVNDHIVSSGVNLVESCELIFVVQNVCIESWFLGNRRIIKRAPEGEKLRDFMGFYNVIEEDPEEMGKMDSYRTTADFHYHYFREVLKEHNLSYRKSRPNVVLERPFFDELIKRTVETNHLSTFRSLLQLLESIRE